jgi:hypothetical protein
MLSSLPQLHLGHLVMSTTGSLLLKKYLRTQQHHLAIDSQSSKMTATVMPRMAPQIPIPIIVQIIFLKANYMMSKLK